jgi:hypothetical protein
MSLSLALSKLVESVPSNGIDFEYCAVQTTEIRTFTLQNTTQSAYKFAVKLDDQCEAFKVFPMQGKYLKPSILVLLKPGLKQDVEIHFTPLEAKVIISTAIIEFIQGESVQQKVLRMSGIGKFPFLSINNDKLDFETLTVGRVETKHLQLKNQSQVKAKF